MRIFARSVLLGAAGTAAGLLVKFEYCMAGPGYGFPAAMIHPAHQEWWLIDLTSPAVVDGLSLDGLSLVINLVVLSATAFGVSAVIERRAGKCRKTQ